MPTDTPTATEAEVAPERARRTGERRQEDAPVPSGDRRDRDRRVRKPGLAGLLRTLLGKH